jgi:arylsulfatase
VAAGLLLLLATSCGRAPAPQATRHQDLIVEPAGHARTYDATTGMQRCEDETSFGIALAAGEHRVYTVDLAGLSSLLVGGCAAGPPGSRARLELSLRAGDGRRALPPVALGTAWQARRVDLPAGAGRVRLRVTAAGGGVRLRDLAVATTGAEPPPPLARRAILVSLDTFREDAIGALGRRAATPGLDELLAESERFAPHWSADISTKPSHASMLSGLPVAVHGCDRGEEPLPGAVTTLAERLHAAGVDTAGFLSVAPFFHERFGLGQGFATWRLAAWSTAQELRAVESWLAEHRDRPFFLFVHLFAAHSDSDRLPYEGEGSTRELVARRFGVPDYGCRQGACASRLLLRLNDRKLPWLPAEPRILRALYDRGVSALDADLRPFLASLRRSGMWDDLLVILTADHGEQFAEHGYFLHTTSHEETLRVPLLVKWPEGARAGRTTARPSSSLDLAPTLLAHFGLPAADLVGQDLARPGSGRRVLVARDAVRAGRLKLLLPAERVAGALYDLARDPAERVNLLAAREDEAEELRRLRSRMMAEVRRRLGASLASTEVPFTAEELERLRALGYAH